MINIGIGVSWAKSLYSVANNIIANFRARVLSYPNSIFEAGPCLDATLEELNAVGLLDDASLIVTPNAYNEGVLYDVIPNTPLGDMDVVRATTATRVNSAGLIEVVPRNLVEYSNTFSDARWQKQNCTITQNYGNNPFGIQNASLIEDSVGTSTQYRISQSIGSNNNVFTLSLYVKRLSGTKNAYIDLGPYTAYFDFTAETIYSTTGNVSFTKLNDGWYRINLSSPTNYNISTIYLGFANAYNETYTSTGGNQMLFYASQLEQGSTATEYFPTTTRLNIPRIDYTNGSCPSLLVEPQRTNIILNSQNFTAATWAPVATTITANAGISPDGTNNANKFIPSTLATSHYISQFFISSTNGSISIYAKADGYNNITLLTSNANVNYNLSTGTVQDVGGVGTGAIQSVGNGWYRCILYKVLTTETLYISCGSNTNAGFFNGSGNGTSGVLIWGGQIEVGAYQTSYIPTVASTVTRNADVISKTGISSLIGQTEGTVFIKADNKILGQTNRTLFYVSDATANNYITLNYSAAQADTIRFFVVGNAALAALGFFVYTAPILKLAVTYKNGVYKLFINGSLIYTQTGNAFNANLESLFVGTNRNLNEPIGERIESLQIYKTELTNAECIALTTL
jgi:hypothetical protein